MPARRASDELDEALVRLRGGSGPVPVTRDGEVVALVLTPEQLERLEDVQDAAVLRAALDRGPATETVSLGALARTLGIALPTS